MAVEDGPISPMLKPGPRLRGLGVRLLDALLPPAALDDAGQASATNGLSAEAWRRITFLDDPVCDGCGAPFEHAMGEGALCAACEVRRRAVSRTRAACLYDEHSRGLILQLKHADRTDLARLFARWLSRAAAPLLEQADVIVPVPLHRWRLLHRRYNQAAEIARPLSALSGRTYLADVLVRSRDTPTQAGRSGGGRRRNVAAAFSVPPGRRKQVAGKRVLLIDDVLTTGATADGCARALRQAGAAEVFLAVIARVRDRPPTA
jgi:ComF family protein